MKTTPGSGGEETEVEGCGEIGDQNNIGVTRGKTEWGVRLGEVCRDMAAEITESPPIHPLRHSATSRGRVKLLLHAPCSFTISLSP